MKKLLMVVALLPPMAFAEFHTETVDGITWTYSAAGGEAIVESGSDYQSVIPSSTSGTITIPSILGGCPVTGVGAFAFRDCRQLTSVLMPEGVISVGRFAFYGCDSLVSVKIPKSVTTIGTGILNGTKLLRDHSNGLVIIDDCLIEQKGVCTGMVIIPENVRVIAGSAFDNCQSLTSVRIPSSVVSIGENAFSHCSSLTSITIPEGTKSIGASAFSRCSSLVSAVISRGVTNIGDYAFSHCGTLLSTTMCEGLVSIGEGAFEDCTSLYSVTIPKSVMRIGVDAFKNAKFLNDHPDGFVIVGDCLIQYKGTSPGSVAIPDSVRVIAGRAFSGISLASVTIPESVMSIGDWAFVGCDFTSITIPDGVTIIGDGAFDGCFSLSSVVIPNGVTRIGDYVFRDCRSLVSITLPEGLTSIGKGAFSYCWSLSSVTIPECVTSIEDCAFSHCALVEVCIPDSVTSIGEDAFRDCSRLVAATLPEGIASISKGLFYDCYSLSSVMIPEGVTHIGDSAFRSCSSLALMKMPKCITSIGEYSFFYCSSLTSIKIPGDVMNIGIDAFGHCGSLVSIAVSEENRSYCSIDGVLYDKSQVSLIQCPGGKVGAVTIPEGVICIGSDAFSGCNMIDSLTLPSSLRNVGREAFHECRSLKEVHISDLAAWCAIDFYGSDSNPLFYAERVYLNGLEMTDVAIPDGVNVIKMWAFVGCHALTSVTIPSTVTSIGSAAFENCDALGSVKMALGLTSVGGGAFRYCTNLTSVIIPEGVTRIGGGAFEGCSRLTSVQLPASVMEIGSDVFDGTRILKDHVDGLVIIDGCVIEYKGECVGEIVLPDKVRVIADYAFYECGGLTSVAIPSSLVSIGTFAFGYCDSLVSVSIPSGVTSIGDSAFDGCGALQIVWFEGPPPFTATAVCGGGLGIGIDGVAIRYNASYARQWLSVLSTRKISNAEPYIPDSGLNVIVGDKVTIDTWLVGYKASGLPSGLKYDAKTGKIIGAAKAATAAEGVVVKFTKKGAEDEELTIVVRAEEISAGCEGLASGPLPAGVAGAAGGMDIQVDSEGGTKSVSVTKLPSGMKYDKKSGKITGAPTKAGDYEVVLTVTTAFGNKETVKIPVSVAAMPVMAVGTFSGFVSDGEDNLGTFTLTTTDAGKLTAKVVTAAGTVSFSGTCWDAVEDGVYRATLTTKKGEKLTLMLDSTVGWDANQLVGSYSSANGRTLDVTAQRNAFGKTWYFAATGDETAGWKLAYTEDTKGAALTVTLKADGSTSIAGKLPNGTDAKGKAVTIKVSASGYANVGGLKDGAILADFAPVLTVNKVKKVLMITANLWFDRKNEVGRDVGQAKLAE